MKNEWQPKGSHTHTFMSATTSTSSNFTHSVKHCFCQLFSLVVMYLYALKSEIKTAATYQTEFGMTSTLILMAFQVFNLVYDKIVFGSNFGKVDTISETEIRRN